MPTGKIVINGKYQVGPQIRQAGIQSSIVSTHFVKNTSTNQLYETRILSNTGKTTQIRQMKKMLFEEMQILSVLSTNPRFQNIVDMINTGDIIALVFEKVNLHQNDSAKFKYTTLFELVKAENTKLAKYQSRKINQLPTRGIREKEALAIFYQIVNAVTFMHQSDIAHRNLTVSFIIRTSKDEQAWHNSG
jgi:serine/threonine protein kinase